MKKISALGIVCLGTIFMAPHLAFASWWNPLTWFSHLTVEKPATSDYSAKTAEGNSELTVQTSLKTIITKNTPIKKKVEPAKKAITPDMLDVVNKLFSTSSNPQPQWKRMVAGTFYDPISQLRSLSF